MEPAPSSIVSGRPAGGAAGRRRRHVAFTWGANVVISVVAGCRLQSLARVVLQIKLGDVKGEVTIELIDYWRRASSVASSLLLLLQ